MDFPGALPAQVGDLLKATQVVVICWVRKSVTTGHQRVTNLADYLRATI